MKIARVNIQGFKSFADPIEVMFDQEVTAVVGPNGCGKSNIADAIRWAMGEQSMRKLRGHALEDVIFSGSESRGPQSMAEVTITFDNTDGLSPPSFDGVPEVAVTRRYFRDSTSEYFLNKVPCRLRDIKELFMGTGAGAGAYSLIEQGRIGWIVTSRPEDKRKLIEEAAGITAYKAHKAVAERKMDRTQQNLSRVNDLINEIEKNLASLKRQAQKAKRYQKYHAEMVDCELHIATHRFLELVLVQKHLHKVLAKLEDEKLELMGAISVKESEVEARRGELFATEMEHSRLQESLFEENNRITLLESQVERGVAEMGSLRQRAVAAAEDHRLHGKRREVLERERGEIEGTLGEMEGRRDEDLRRTATLEEELTRRRTLYDQAGREVNRIGELVVDNARRRTALSARMDEISRLVDSERRRLGELDQERIGIEGRLGELESEGKVSDGEIARAEDECRAKESYRVGQLREVDTLKGDIRSQDGIVEADAEALSAARSRLEAVEERIDRRENLTGPATLVKEASRDGTGKEGLHALSESVTFREGYEAAAAAVLESVLEALVVDGHDEVLTWYHFLETLGKKGAGFVPRTHAGGRLVPSLPELEGATRLRDHVDARAGDEKVVDRLLAGVYVVDDIESALALHRRTRGGAVFVTRDGTIVGHGGEVTVRDETRDASASLQSEAESLRQRVRELERRHEASQARRTATRESIVASTHAAEEAVGHIHEIEKKLLTLKARRRRYTDETTRLTERLATLSVECETIRTRTAALDEEMQSSREAEAQLSGEGSGLDVRGAEARATAEELRKSAESQAAELSAWEMVVQGHAAERTRIENKLQELLQGLAEAEAGMKRAGFELESNHRQQGRALGEIFRCSEEKETRLAKASVLKTDVTQAKEKFEDLRLEIQEAEAGIRELRKQIDALGKKLSERDRQIVQINADLDLLRERVSERTRLVLEESVTEYHNRRPPTEKTVERRDELRHLIERMGAVNLLAIQEYEDAQARHADLTAQRDDTQQALDALQKAIAKLNRECRKRFREAFTVINERFQEVFPTLFEGGKARLELTDESDMLETGVEIYAQPPGKKIGNLSVMSGGEKALTAVALIFAMFQFKPSPFCLLDEVDAPLDDVNVGRVMDMLRTMTDRSQFILVTHSKITMERADKLYGVTMEEPGITKLISVRLSQAERFSKPVPGESAA